MSIATEVLQPSPTRFTMYGKALPNDLNTTDEQVSPGLAKRLARYALNRLQDSGFRRVVEPTSGVVGKPELGHWATLVYTIDGDDRPSERSYCVRFTNREGGYIEVVGILTSRGWPSLDHGLFIGES